MSQTSNIHVAGRDALCWTSEKPFHHESRKAQNSEVTYVCECFYFACLSSAKTHPVCVQNWDSRQVFSAAAKREEENKPSTFSFQTHFCKHNMNCQASVVTSPNNK